MGQKRVLIGYGIDVDAVANHINTTVGGKPNLTNVSRGVFGAIRGVERLLELCEEKNIKCSWYIPGHTIETFPEDMAKIRDAGHEIGLHGYTHEFASDLTREQLEAIFVKTINIQTDFCGKPPLGFTSPAWKNHPDQVEIMTKLGITYSHCFMHDDFQPYYVSTGREEMITTDYTRHPDEWMVRMKHAEKSEVVEIPANWTLDDWPPFQWDGARPNAPLIHAICLSPKPEPDEKADGTVWQHGYVDPYTVERTWKDMFTWCYRHYNTFIFPISIHPQVSGRPHILMMHERFIDWVNEHEGVEWCTFAQMADEFRKGGISGTGK